MSEKFVESMNLSALDLLVLSTLIENIQLGGSNAFEDAISRIAVDLEEYAIEQHIEAARAKYGTPQLVITASMNDGILLSLQ